MDSGRSDKSRIAHTYNAASDHLDALPFWHHFGRRTVERLELARGAHVLDLCCGTGASALAAADRVGSVGHVLGVDLSSELIAIARANAARSRVLNTEFCVADVETLTIEPASLDAIVTVFGLFFIDDMAALLTRAWNWLRPGGTIAVTTWGRHVLEPGEPLFWEAVAREDASITPMSHAGRLPDAAAIAAVFDDAGLPPPAIAEETWHMPLETPDAFWPVILGTSNRAAWEALAPAARTRVKESVTSELRKRCVKALRCDAVYAVVRR